MNDEVKQAILLAIDALESCCDDWVYDDRNGREYLVRDFEDQKVKAALKALQALEWEETDFSHIDRAALMKELLPEIQKMFGVAYKEWEEKK